MATKTDETVRLALDRLTPSPFQSRKLRNPEADQEFAASVAKRGILVPILVRPVRRDGEPESETYEILAGHRRFEAATKAGQESVPVRILECSDDEAREIVVIENLQRADVHPLDEADAFVALLDRANGDLETVASKVGKTRAYVARRAVLSKLAPEWRKCWLDPKFDFTIEHGFLLARLDPARQKELHKSYRDFPSVDGLRDDIDRKHLLSLSRVPWVLDSPEVLPKAGPCSTCPKRAGANADLFVDLKSDTCTDRKCFTDKFDQWAMGRRAEIKEKDGQALHLITAEWSARERGVLGTDKWMAVLNKKPCESSAMGVFSDPHDKGFGKIIPICLGMAKCKVHRGQSYDGGLSTGERPKRSAAELATVKKKNRKIRRQLMENNAVLDRVIAAWKPELGGMREIAATFWQRLWGDSKWRLAKRRGWAKKRAELDGYRDDSFDFEKDALLKMSIEDCLSFMLESSVVQEVGDESNPALGDTVKGLAKKLAVDMVAVKADVDLAIARRESDRAVARKAAADARKVERVASVNKAKKAPAKAKGKK